MKGCRRMLCLVVPVILGWSMESPASNTCSSPITVGPEGSGTCGGANCNFNSWAAAIDYCKDTYTQDLEIKLFPMVDVSSVSITGAYNMGNYELIIHAVEGPNSPYGNPAWDTGSFRCTLGATDSAYAIAITMASTGNHVRLENIQVRREYTNSTPDRWADMLVALGTGHIILRNSFIWLHVPSEVTFSGRGKALYLGAGDKDIENVVIFGDKRTTSQYQGFLNFAAYIMSDARTVHFTNVTVYGRGTYKGFVTGLYTYGGDTYVDNSYIRVKSSTCTPYAVGGDYNVASCSSVVGAHSQASYSTEGTTDFENPEPSGDDAPDFHVKSESYLIDHGATLLEHDVEGDHRSTTTSDVGADEFEDTP